MRDYEKAAIAEMTEAHQLQMEAFFSVIADGFQNVALLEKWDIAIARSNAARSEMERIAEEIRNGKRN